ncbi:hypothetical protein RI129_012490 [Pyrocoelia pectoralis]|uniref:Histidine-rich glycoprotein-like n=1 Tax=Pyrocoelia pectoralis TaxID=417401 RepID=A0AAN7Z600_9COLE
MFCNIYVILAIFSIFCVPCNCGLGKGVDVCSVEEDTPLVVRPHTLPKVDIAAISSHHHHHHHHHGSKGEIGGGHGESNIAPLQPVGDLCTCGKTIVKPANVPAPLCSGCSDGSVHTEHSGSHHHHSSDSSHHHHDNTYHGIRKHGGPFNPHGPHHHKGPDGHFHSHGSGPHHHKGPGGHFHSHGSGPHHHEGPDGLFHSHGSGPHSHKGPGGHSHSHGSGPHNHKGPGSAHDHHRHHSTWYHEDHNKVHKVGFGHKGSHVHHGHNFGHRRGHDDSGPYVQEKTSDSGDDSSDYPHGSSYYQIGGSGTHHLGHHGHGHSTHVGDFHIDYPIHGLPVMHQHKVHVHTSQVPADAISKAIARNQLLNKQDAVEHLQFGTRTLPRDEPATQVQTEKKVFSEESYYRHNGETLELGKLHQQSPVEEVEIEEEEEEPEPEHQQVVIQPISYHSIGFVPSKIKPHKFITPMVIAKPEPIVPCGVGAPPHCGDGYKSGNVIIKNVPISSDASEATCDEDAGNAEYTYSQSSSSSSSSSIADSHSTHYRRTGCATCGR